MKKYCLVVNNVVTEIIPRFDAIFPSIPIEERYAKEFLDNCIAVDENTEVEVGDVYSDGSFTKQPPVEIPPEPEPTPGQPKDPDLKIQELEQQLLEVQQYIINKEAEELLKQGGI
ncbi:hypothetical protein NE686_00605 [Tissierella carlieri]|uniref:Uncharacterized protein n=1 Tax=Tissierella carlieri TaxID=689904 RepID=A0ABT1S540_9FIRM|nr:hypothetical protein [Tissierella carlieri]MCQ4921569.1 hypothetical protein [Tissierella carlieri]